MEPFPPLPSSWKFLIGLGGCYAAAHLLHYLAPRLGIDQNKQTEYGRISSIIRKKGIGAAHSMTLGELAEDLRGYGSIWRNLADSNEKGGMKSDCVLKPDVAVTDPFAYSF